MPGDLFHTFVVAHIVEELQYVWDATLASGEWINGFLFIFVAQILLEI